MRSTFMDQLPVQSRRILPDNFKLLSGSHNSAEDGMCLLEATAYLAGEPHNDRPACVCPVLAAFGRRLNDNLKDADRQLLVGFAEKLIGTRSNRAVEQKRMYYFADSAVRIFAPMVMESRGRTEAAKKLRELPAIVDKASALVARDAAYAAATTATADAATAAATAATAAAYAAATAAAYAAAYAAAAAAYAADATADAATAATAYAATAYAAAYAARMPVIQEAVKVFEQAIAITE
jgi:hypothetical protein